MVLLDTSVIIAYYLPESYSAQAQAYYVTNPQLAVSNLIAVETVSVVSRLVRTGSLSQDAAKQMVKLFNEHWGNGFYVRIDLESRHFQLARQWITRFDLPLNAPDALHLSVASVGETTLVTADRQLARNAEALDISVDLLVVTSP